MKIDAGLINGRHKIPVNNYIFEEAIEDVTDYGDMQCTVLKWIYQHCMIEEPVELYVYVTGLTAAMLSVVKVCNDLNNRGWNIILFAMNYDLVSGKYLKQPVLRKEN